jgi:type II secretory pathway predicted ATPase ExeA
MYEEYWQLERRPFEPNAKREFFYPAETHQGALLKLRYAVENRRGAAVLAGPPGTGKTLLIHTLREQLGDRYRPFIHLVFPQMEGRDLLVYLAETLGAPPDDPPRYTVEESIRRIELVLTENQVQERHAVIAVDEAHLLWESGLLETLRLILNLGGESEPPFTLLLAGQPRILSCLERIPDLDERMAVKTLIRALSADETAGYISHRLKAAGAGRDIFDASALDELYVLSQGVPRAINRLCDLALLIGYAQGQEVLRGEDIAAVSEELVTVAPE